MTIRRIEGEKVYGQIRWTGGTIRPPYDYEGRLDGNRLTWISPDGRVKGELSISGNTMSGRSVSSDLPGWTEISVTKAK